MTLRRKVGLWIVVLIVAIVIIALMPAATKLSLSDTVNGWFDSYNDAVENSHDDDDDEDDDDVPIERLMVRIDDDISDYAGIETSALVSSHFFPESKATATVVNIRPLLAIKSQYNQALAALNVAKVAERSAVQELNRLNTLAKGVGSVAAKKVNYARAVWREANATLQGLEFEVQAVKDDALQSWGGQITDWVLAKDSEQWQRLLSHQDSLLSVVLPVDVSLVAEVSFIRIARDGAYKQARKAYYVSPAVNTDTLVQGESYFFKTTTGKLRTGMRLDAWIPKTNTPLEGVFVPDHAVVWYEGQPWVYVEKEADLYQRRSVLQGLTATGGLFVEDNLVVGEKLVMQGAQMLLSEEFRWQILDEDDD